jgi:putative YpdA family bacillithiol system oxidoreductase
VGVDLVAKWTRDPCASLGKLDVFSPLDPADLSALSTESKWIELMPGDRLSTQADPAVKESYYFVAEGQIGVCAGPFAGPEEKAIDVKVRTLWNSPSAPPRRDGTPGHEHLFIAVFSAGDFFSDSYRRVAPRSGRDGIDCVAIMQTLLVVVDRDSMRDLAHRYPRWAKLLDDRNHTLRRRYQDERTPAAKVIQNFFLKHNYSFATTLRVIDLDHCINCDGCDRACAERHGRERLHRKGPVLGVLQFPITCRTCVDHRCLDACGFDALGMAQTARGPELKINARKCVGCTACYNACPNGVIEMLEAEYTVEDFPKPTPFTTNDGMTNVEGLYLTGEATGTALIKLAINGGRRAVEHANEALKKLNGERKRPGVKDVIVVGAGPAGLSASLTCMELGLDFAVFDKGHYATTIQSYPRHKIVMAEPAHIPMYGKVWFQNATKEEIIEHWDEMIKKTGLRINSFEGVKSAKRGTDGVFDVETEKGRYRAHKVVLAVGTRGAPRKLGVAGEAEPRVQYTLTEPQKFAGRHVLVVGGGDSAVEAAMSIADESPGSKVTISYRQDQFGRIKAGNKSRIATYSESGKLGVLLKSSVKALRDGEVVLKCDDGDKTIPNDVIFALLGAEPPTKFFQEAGIEVLEPKSPGMAKLAASRGIRKYASKCDHCSDFADQACITACPTGAIMEVRPNQVFVDVVEREHHFSEQPFVDGLRGAGLAMSAKLRRAAQVSLLLTLTAGAMLGAEALLRCFFPEYSLQRLTNQLMHINGPVAFWPGRGLGFSMGVVGLALMAITALYPLHSRNGVGRGYGRTKFWLMCHIAAGLLGPYFVLLHTRLKLDRWPSLAFWAMVAVVFSGWLGKVMAVWIRKASSIASLHSDELGSAREHLLRAWGEVKGKTRLLDVDKTLWHERHLDKGGRLTAPFELLFNELHSWYFEKRLKYWDLRNVEDQALKARTLAVFIQRAHEERRRMLLDYVQSSVASWRYIHRVLTMFMFATALVHVVISMLYRVS